MALLSERVRFQGVGRILRLRGALLHQTVQDVLLRARNLKKVFRSGNSDLVLFENLSLDVRSRVPAKVPYFTYSERLIALPKVTYTSPNLNLAVSPKKEPQSSAAGSLGLSGSFIICCQSLRPWKMSLCPC